MTSQAKGTPSSSEYAAYYYHLYFPDAAHSADHTIRSYQINSARKQLKALDKLVEQLVNNAVVDGDDPPLFSSDFDSLVRGRKGYFIVGVTGAEFDGDDPIGFTLADSSTGAGGNGSHTFDFVQNFSKTVGIVKVSVAVYYDRMQSAYHHRNLAI